MRKELRSGLESVLAAHKIAAEAVAQSAEQLDRQEAIEQLKAEMLQAAQELDFERAARLRDRMQELENAEGGGKVSASVLDLDTEQEKGPRKTGRRGRRMP